MSVNGPSGTQAYLIDVDEAIVEIREMKKSKDELTSDQAFDKVISYLQAQ